MDLRKQLVDIGNNIMRAKPNDIRAVLESPLISAIDGEDQGKAMRFALEMARIDKFLDGDYSPGSLAKLKDYKIAVALEQDASSSGAQIIALTTRNKQLARLSNVVPTDQKQRLNFGLIKFRELLETPSLEDNQQPSLGRDSFEGSTTKTYQLEQLMKSVQPSGWKRGTYI